MLGGPVDRPHSTHHPPHLLERMRWLRQAAIKCGHQVNWDGEDEDVVDGVKTKYPHSSPASNVSDGSSVSSSDNVNVMKLVYYKNQMLHVFVYQSMVVKIISSSPSNLISKADLSDRFSFLVSLLRREVIFCDEKGTRSLDRALLELEELSILSLTASPPLITFTSSPLLAALLPTYHSLLDPYLLAVWLTSSYLRLTSANLRLTPANLRLTPANLRLTPAALTAESLARDCQLLAHEMVRDQITPHPELLSLPLLRNALLTLPQLGCLDSSIHPWCVDEMKVNETHEIIGNYCDIPKIDLQDFVMTKGLKVTHLAAKL